MRTLERHGDLRARYRGVYIATTFPATREQAWLAAVFACGKDVALSRGTGAVHLSLLTHPPAKIHVTKPGKSGAQGPKGITLHHALHLDSFIYNGIRTTTPIQTLNDLAPTLHPPSLKAAVRQAERLHRLDLATAEAAPALERFLTSYVPAKGTTNDFEADFLELCARHQLPRPETQVEIGPYVADFAWPEAMLVVETDGRASHDTFVSFREDRARTRYLQQQGYMVLQFTFEEVRDEPAKVTAEIRAALAGRRRMPSSP